MVEKNGDIPFNQSEYRYDLYFEVVEVHMNRLDS